MGARVRSQDDQRDKLTAIAGVSCPSGSREQLTAQPAPKRQARVRVNLKLMSNWGNGRPIFDSLPEKGYRDNEVADALTSWVDQELTEKAALLQNFYRQLDPVLCDSDKLDFLAYLNGLSGNFWDSSWQDDVKRKLIANAHPVLWDQRGTAAALHFVLSTHKLRYDLWVDGNTNLSFSMPAKMATPKLRFFIRLPVTYHRGGTEWREAVRTARNFAPAIVRHEVCYDYFRCGFSRLGEPMFNQGSFTKTL